jgi:hypothetical protein
LAFVVQTTFAQVTKDLGEFSTIKIYDRLTVSLISSSENKIVITGNSAKKITIKLRMPFPFIKGRYFIKKSRTTNKTRPPDEASTKSKTMIKC